jgi:Flp pilus assembly protein TadG
VRALVRDRRGQSNLVAFVLIVPLLVVVLGMATFVVRVRPAQVSVAAAARSCARQAVDTLSPAQGVLQGQHAAYAVLDARHLDVAQATVQVTPLGPWDRFTRVQCDVSYHVDLRPVPYLVLFSPTPTQQLTASYQLAVEPRVSRWGE